MVGEGGNGDVGAKAEAKPARPGVSASAHQSLLDEAAHFAFDPLVGLVTSNRDTQQSIVEGAKALAKTVPLFMSGLVGRIALGVAYSTDEIKTSDSTREGLEDAGLGLLKGAALSITRDAAMARNVSPSLVGVELGLVNRASQTGLTRDNYTDLEGNFSLTAGLKKTAMTAFNPLSLAADVATFTAADIVWGKAILSSRGGLFYNPTFTHALQGGVFGVSSGLGSEIANQWTAGHFDSAALAWSAFSQGSLGVIGGGIGGLHSASRLSIAGRDTAADIAAARSTPFQKGEIVDAAQQILRDGAFTVNSEGQGAFHTRFLFGNVESQPGVKMPTIFRVDNGTPAFAKRMQTEIGVYGLDQRWSLDGGTPTTVARTMNINGQILSGYMQEMRGQTLRHYLSGPSPDGNISRATARQIFEDQPDLVPAFKSAFVKREVLQQYDNHSLNLMVDTSSGTIASKSVLGIDLDPLREARSSLDWQPIPAHRHGWDNIASRLYARVAGQAIPKDTRSSLQTFQLHYNTDEGRAELRGLGFTNRQIDGILARSKWFTDNGIMPRGMEPLGFQTVWPYVKALKNFILPKPSAQPLIAPPAPEQR